MAITEHKSITGVGGWSAQWFRGLKGDQGA